MKEKPVLPATPRSKPTWLPLVGSLLVVGLLALMAIRSCMPAFETGFGNETTYAPPGEDPARFNPITAIEAIQSQIGDGAELMQMSSTYVKSDGTQDLTTELYYARSDYEFVREVPAPDNAPPIGAGGSASGRWYQVTHVDIFDPGQWRQVTGTNNYSYLHKGMALDVDTPTGTKPDTIALPQCAFSLFWEHAIAEGIPADAVARISYDDDGYDFYITDLNYRASFDTRCQVIGN